MLRKKERVGENSRKRPRQTTLLAGFSSSDTSQPNHFLSQVRAPLSSDDELLSPNSLGKLPSR
jgi:hypothetical protein